MMFYDCSTAPSPRRVRIFLAEKGLEVPTEQVDLRAGAQHEEPFISINPHRTVPVLVLDDGTRLTSSAGICAYLEALHPEPALFGSAPQEKGAVADWAWRTEHEGIMAVAEALRNRAKGMSGRALTGAVGYEQIPELAERGLRRIDQFFLTLDDALAEREFVAGERYSVADINALVAVDFAGWVKKSLPESAVNARRWHEAVSARPSAQA